MTHAPVPNAVFGSSNSVRRLTLAISSSGHRRQNWCRARALWSGCLVGIVAFALRRLRAACATACARCARLLSSRAGCWCFAGAGLLLLVGFFTCCKLVAIFVCMLCQLRAALPFGAGDLNCVSLLGLVGPVYSSPKRCCTGYQP